MAEGKIRSIHPQRSPDTPDGFLPDVEKECDLSLAGGWKHEDRAVVADKPLSRFRENGFNLIGSVKIRSKSQLDIAVGRRRHDLDHRIVFSSQEPFIRYCRTVHSNSFIA